MLMKLTLKAYRLSKLATELEGTLQEAHRNMAHLTDSGLVSKNSDGDLVLTPYSKATISLIPSYNFLFNNNDYFLDHNLGDLPIQFIQRIGHFQNCEVVHGVRRFCSDGRCFTHIYRIH
jgi:predicted transcriptional regulator